MGEHRAMRWPGGGQRRERSQAEVLVTGASRCCNTLKLQQCLNLDLDNLDCD